MEPQNPDQIPQTPAPGVDYSRLSPELQSKLQTWHKNGQQAQQGDAFQSAAQTLQMAVNTLSMVATSLGTSEHQYTQLLQKMQSALSNLDNIQQFDQVLGDMQQTLSILKDVERPQMPDYASPVVEAVSRLEGALQDSMQAIANRPTPKPVAPQVTVPAPQVSVDVDLARVEQILQRDIPQAFEKAIKAIPKTEIPKVDQAPIVDTLKDISEQLVSLENATRMKPQPGSMRISNLTEEPMPSSATAATIPDQTTLQNRAVANGTGKYLTVEGYAVALLQVLSTTAMSGGTTVNFEASVDGTNWTAIMAQGIGAGTLATTTTADGDYRLNVAGYKLLRARISSYSAGNTTIIGFVSPVAAQATLLALSSIVPGTGATNLGKAEDAAHTSGDTGVMSLAVRNNTAAALAGTDADYIPLTTDTNGALWASLATLLAGEDLTNNKMVVEHQYSYSRKTADGQVKATAGFVHAVTIAPTTATPTAGLLTVYDSAAESGTAIFSEWVFATTPAHTVFIDATASTGIYVGYDATLANVSCTVSYR